MKSKWVKASDLAKAKSWKFDDVPERHELKVDIEPKPGITIADFDWRVKIHKHVWYGAARANLTLGGAPLTGVAVFVKDGEKFLKYLTTEKAAYQWLTDHECPEAVATDLFKSLPVEKNGRP